MDSRGSGAGGAFPHLPERLALGALVVAGVLTSFRLQWIVRTEPGLPLWDEAAQSLVGAQLLDALRAFHPLEFLAILNAQVVWPFVHGLLLVPWMAGSGNDWESAARFSAFLMALLPLAVFAAGARLGTPRGTWIGLGAAALLLIAPRYQIFGTLGMLEIPGATLLATTLACHVAGLAPGAQRRTWILAGVTTTALFLLKYNYGTLWLAALTLFELGELPAARRAAIAARLRAWLAAGGWRRPLPLIALLWALALIALVATGGFDARAFGRTISVHSAGNPAYGLFVLLAAWLAVAIAQDPARWRARWAVLSERHRVLLAAIALPLAVWFLIPYPNRVRAFIEFSINRDAGPAPWSFAGLLFYPRAFLTEFAPWPIGGAIVLLLALVPPRRSEPAGVRLVWLAGVVGLAATMLHRYHDARFLLTTVVPLALAATARAVTWFDVGLASRTPRLAWAAWTAVLIAFAALPLLGATGDARIRTGHRAYRAPQDLAAPLADVVRQSVGASRTTVLLGWCEAVSPALLAWRARAVLPRGTPYEPPRRLAWLPAGATDAALAARIAPVLDRPGAILALAFELASPLPARLRSELWADSVTAARLERDPRVTLERRDAYEATGIQLRRWRVEPARH